MSDYKWAEELQRVEQDQGETVIMLALGTMCTLHGFGVNKGDLMVRGYDLIYKVIREIYERVPEFMIAQDALVLFREAAFRWELENEEGEHA